MILTSCTSVRRDHARQPLVTRLSPPEQHPSEAGKRNPEIGIILHTRPRAVAKHLQRIFKKLDVDNRTAAAITLRNLRGSAAT